MSAQNATLTLEVFTEELPPKSLRKLGESFSAAIFTSLQQAQLLSPHSKALSFASPRRLAVQIDGVLNQAPNYPVREKLLPVSIAFDAAGKPSAPLLKKADQKAQAQILLRK